MPFPESERVTYRKNPLIEVIAQLRFPPILRIEADLPADFQDRLRGEYPLLAEGHQVSELKGIPSSVMRVIEAEVFSRRKSFDFVSADAVWKVSLTRDFVALSTSKYERWEEFRGRMERIIQALRDSYTPEFCTRIGLRYRDAIERSILGLNGSAWSELVRPELAGPLAAPAIAAEVIEAIQNFTLALGEAQSKVKVAHGLAINEETKETAYLIDADFFNDGQTEIAHTLEVLDVYNRYAGRLFRWFITERLHEAMEPSRSPS